MPSPSTAIVIGGGIIGLNVALSLQQCGLDVRLIDAGSEIRPASWGNAGHIATEQVEPLASWPMIRSLPRRLFMTGGPVGLPPRELAAWLPFGLRLIHAASPARFAAGKAALGALMAEALPAWRRRMAAIGRPDLLVEDGHVVIWESDATAKAGRAAWSRADTGPTRFRDLTASESEDLNSLLRKPVADAIRFEGTARVADPGEVLIASRSAFEAAGGRYEQGTLSLDDHTLAGADAVVVTAGILSADLLRPLGHRVPIIAERGYHLQSLEGGAPDGGLPMIFEDRALFVARFRSGLRATSFIEFGRPEAPPDPRKWDRLRDHARDLGLPFENAAAWMGARPTLPDYLPAIGRSRLAPNLFYAFGHQHLGLTLGPITGELMAALMTGETPSVATDPFDIDRF